MNVLVPLAAVAVLFLLGLLGAAAGLGAVFGVVVPYAAFVLFAGGVVYRVMSWAKVPVPFRIPTTCGQQRSLAWIRSDSLDNPHSTAGVVGRMVLEVFFFRSLLRNTKTERLEDGRVVYGSSLWLWLGALAFHGALLAILIRHLRLFSSPVPFPVTFLEQADGFMQVGVPVFYATSFVFLAALAYLLLRRLFSPQLRYLSLAADYFPLFLLLGIGVSGFWLRHVAKTDVVGIKELALGLASLRGISGTDPTSGLSPNSPLFYGHFFLVCVLAAYFPFSKLMHMAGVFLSPTRNMANNNRRVRHVNPWDHPVKVHAYEEYEDDFREKMKAAGIPVERE